MSGTEGASELSTSPHHSSIFSNEEVQTPKFDIILAGRKISDIQNDFYSNESGDSHSGDWDISHLSSPTANLPSPTVNYCNESGDSNFGDWDISHLSSPTMNLPSPTLKYCNESGDSHSGDWDISHLSSPTTNLPSPTSSDMDILFCSPETGGVLEIESILGRHCKKRVEEFDTLQPSKKRKLLWDSPVKDELCSSINNKTNNNASFRSTTSCPSYQRMIDSYTS